MGNHVSLDISLKYALEPMILIGARTGNGRLVSSSLGMTFSKVSSRISGSQNRAFLARPTKRGNCKMSSHPTAADIDSWEGICTLGFFCRGLRPVFPGIRFEDRDPFCGISDNDARTVLKFKGCTVLSRRADNLTVGKKSARL